MEALYAGWVKSSRPCPVLSSDRNWAWVEGKQRKRKKQRKWKKRKKMGRGSIFPHRLGFITFPSPSHPIFGKNNKEKQILIQLVSCQSDALKI